MVDARSYPKPSETLKFKYDRFVVFVQVGWNSWIAHGIGIARMYVPEWAVSFPDPNWVDFYVEYFFKRRCV